MSESAMRPTNVRLSQECLDQIGSLCDQFSMSRSDVIRKGINLLCASVPKDGSGRLAIVDSADVSGSAHFRVLQWVDFPVS